MNKIYGFWIFLLVVIIISCQGRRQGPEETNAFQVTAYYSGNGEDIENYPIEKLTQIIYSFLHLKGNKLAVDNPADSLTILKLVTLKEKHPELKVLLSLGGWGGCKTCSEVFSAEAGRQEFAQSLKDLLILFNADGIDLDWEYPAIEGVPGHPFSADDKQNFTLLVKEMRRIIGDDYLISFAAGGFEKYFRESIEWNEAMAYLDYVNIMTYDLVHGYSTRTGHHTPLYSTDEQKESVDFAVSYLDSIGVPKSKMVIGAAFYARLWERVEPKNNGLYQDGNFKYFWCYFKNKELLTQESGYEYFWDSIAHAPYMYNSDKKLYATFDDQKSLALKTRYALENQLGGIMFWELVCDVPSDGLLGIINKSKQEYQANN